VTVKQQLDSASNDLNALGYPIVFRVMERLDFTFKKETICYFPVTQKYIGLGIENGIGWDNLLKIIG